VGPAPILVIAHPCPEGRISEDDAGLLAKGAYANHGDSDI